jgi:hypothetical protein
MRTTKPRRCWSWSLEVLLLSLPAHLNRPTPTPVLSTEFTVVIHVNVLAEHDMI